MWQTQRNDIAALTLSRLETGVVRTLLYFDIFDYPLTRKEIIDFLPHKTEALDTDGALENLRKQNLIFAVEDFYSLRPDRSIADRRMAGNKLASKRLKTAKFFGKFIARFPFVRAVMLSGSISKNYMEKSSDIDYFVVTAPGRLWLTRGLLALFKRIFLLNSHKFFCTNYFIDTNSLEIEEKNIYTAVEISTLIPVSGNDIYEKFLERNRWIKKHLPNSRPQVCLLNIQRSYMQRFCEKVLSLSIGNFLNAFFHRIALRRLEERYRRHFNTEDFNIAFKSTANISKNHPHFYQKKTLDNYSLKIREFENLNNLNLQYE